MNIYIYVYACMRSFLYENADTDTWQKAIIEQQSDMADGWLTLREPSSNFFDKRRMRDLSAGSVSHRPTTSSSSSRPTWGKTPDDLRMTARRPATVSTRDVWYDEHEKEPLVERPATYSTPIFASPVQFLPKYMTKIARPRPPKSGLVVTTRYKPEGENPEDVYQALVHPKHVPTLDLARAGLKSASDGAYDRARPVTHANKRFLKMPSSARGVRALPGTRHRDKIDETVTQLKFTRREISALPEPLQEALLLQASPQDGKVFSRTVRHRNMRSDFHVVSELIPDTFAASSQDQSVDAVSGGPAVALRVRSAARSQLTPRQRKAFHQSSEVLQHTAAHCNTLQHTAAHCNSLHTATHYYTLQHTETLPPLSFLDAILFSACQCKCVCVCVCVCACVCGRVCKVCVRVMCECVSAFVFGQMCTYVCV